MNTINTHTTNIHEMIEIMIELFKRCHMDTPGFHLYQNAASNLDIVEVLVQIAKENKDDPEVLKMAFKVIGQMGFSNQGTSSKTANTISLVNFVVDILADTSVSAKIKKNAIYSVANAVANSWDDHPRLVVIIPYLVQFLESDFDNELCIQCVLTLGNFAYNQKSHKFLLEAGALKSLAKVVAKGDANLLPTSAAIAIANLAGSSGHSLSQTMPSLSSNETVMNLVRNAFESTLNKQDYPPGSSIFYSDWKLAIGLANLATCEEGRRALHKADITPLLGRALSQSHDPRLVGPVLQTLWLLCDEKKNNSKQSNEQK
eukprot:c8474_g1_i1.p1 GENE.c8474_g1_i1~~c8474_g1_i1.p1  ORF type:complete len:349 (-),score=70.07 c8474_g1_i1:43-990(-)